MLQSRIITSTVTVYVIICTCIVHVPNTTATYMSMIFTVVHMQEIVKQVPSATFLPGPFGNGGGQVPAKVLAMLLQD